MDSMMVLRYEKQCFLPRMIGKKKFRSLSIVNNLEVFATEASNFGR